MNIRIKAVLTAVLFVAFTTIMLAAARPFVLKKDGSKMAAVKIEADRRGVLLISKTASIKVKMNPRDYIYAWIPIPVSIKKAHAAIKGKKYADAASLFNKLYGKYKYLGWGDFCVLFGAQALQKLDKNSQAISRLTLLTAPPKNPVNLKYYMAAQKLLAQLYAKTGNSSKTLAALKILGKSNDDSSNAFANNLQGAMLLKQGKSDDAKLMYMRTALLFDQSNKKERPEALLKIIEILKKEKNNKAIEFEKILKTDYPGVLIP